MKHPQNTTDHESQPELLFLAQGAEAKVYKGEFLGRPCIIKKRIPKKYRHPVLEEKLSCQRLTAEARGMVRARKHGIDCPTLYFVDTTSRILYMEYIKGLSLKEFLDHEMHRRNDSKSPSSVQHVSSQVLDVLSPQHLASILESLPKSIGIIIAKLHNSGYIHGDLTPSNILLRFYDSESNALHDSSETKSSYGLVLTDFALGYTSVMVEHRAVDLYVLERALAPYKILFHNWELAMLEEGYFKHVNHSQVTRSKLTEVRSRGRKRAMIG